MLVKVDVFTRAGATCAFTICGVECHKLDHWSLVLHKKKTVQVLRLRSLERALRRWQYVPVPRTQSLELTLQG